MKDNNRGSMIILTVIGIATLLVAVIGATFAYFTVTIKYETEPTPAVVQTSTMLIQFKTLNELRYEGAIPGRPSQSDDPTAQLVDNKLQFSLTSAPNMTVTNKYNVYLVIDDNDEGGQATTENDFVTDNLVYMMNQINREVSAAATTNGTPGVAGVEVIDQNKKTTDLIIENNVSNTRDVGVIPHELKAGDKILIGTGELGSHGTVDTWELEVWLKEVGVEQNEDQGKVLMAHIEVEPIDQLPVTYEPDKVTTP